MKERPIIFSTEMIKAILDGRKTQTRRVVKGKWALEWLQPGMFSPQYVADPGNSLSPYGYPGDLLWVRETFSYTSIGNSVTNKFLYKATDDFNGPWRPSIFMPRFVSRITLKIINVRVERLQDISDDDAEAEGFEYFGETLMEPIPPDKFIHYWDSKNAKRGYSWDSNPWVWVISFEMLKNNGKNQQDSGII